MTSTIRASTATWLVFATVVFMGLTPLWAEEPTGTSSGTKNNNRQSLSPSGKGEGVVNVPSMPEPHECETGDFGANGCRVVSTMTLSASGVVLQLPPEAPTVVATYEFNGIPVTTNVQDRMLHFDTGSLEAARAEKVESIGILLAASENQYVRARLELPPGTEQVTVRIE